jgi:hypothetical protein
MPLLIEDDEEKKPEEIIKGVFITLSLIKTNFEEDCKNCLSMFKKVQQQLKKKIHIKKISEYFVINEFGKNDDNPHIHIVMMFHPGPKKKYLNHTQIGRIIKYPVRKILNPLWYDTGDGKKNYWCKTKICGNKEYLYSKYLKKEKENKKVTTIEYNINWPEVKKVNDKWMNNNLHKKTLKLKHISKNTLPNRIIDYAEWKGLPLDNKIEYIHVVETMYRDKYNMSSLYMSNSLMRQVFNCIRVLKSQKFNYFDDYYIKCDERLKKPDLDMRFDRKVCSKALIEKLQYIAKTI